jgi:PGF-CTERM protein
MVSLGLGYVMAGVATAQHGLPQNPEGAELGYDDGEVDSQCSLGDWGHAVFFSNEGKLNIYGIKICGARFDDASRRFDVEIWDNNLKTLYSANYAYTDFFPDTYSPLDDSDLKWVTIDVPNIEVNGNFYITVFTYSGPPSWDKGAHDPHAPTGGIAIGRDSDTKSGNSFIVDKNPNSIVDWETLTTWDIRQEDTDWMIRVVTAQGAPTTLSADFSIEPPQNINLGDVVTFDPSSSTGDVVSSKWDFGDGEGGPQSLLQPVKRLYTSSGTFAVKLTVAGVDGNSKSITKTVNVNSKYKNSKLDITLVRNGSSSEFIDYDIVLTKNAPLNIQVEKYSNGDGLSEVVVGSAYPNSAFKCVIDMIPGVVTSKGVDNIMEKALKLVSKEKRLLIRRGLAIFGFFSNLADLIDYIECTEGYNFIEDDKTNENGNLIVHVPYESAKLSRKEYIGDETRQSVILYKEIMDHILETDNLKFQETPEQIIYINKEKTGLCEKTVNHQKFAYMKKIDPSALPERITFYYEHRIQKKEKAMSSLPKLEISVKRQIKDYNNAVYRNIPLNDVSICIIVNDMCQSIGSTSSDGILRLTEDELVHIDPHGTYTLVAGDGDILQRKKKQFTFNNEGTTHVDIVLEKKELPIIPSYITIFAKTPQNYPDLVNYPHAKSIENFINNKGTFAEYCYPNPDDIFLDIQNIEMINIISKSDWVIVLCSPKDMQKIEFSPSSRFHVDSDPDILEEGTGWKIIKYDREVSGKTYQHIYYIVSEDKTEILETAVKEFFEIMEQKLGPSGTPVESSSGEGAVYFDTDTATIKNIIAVNVEDIPEAPLRDVNLPYGLFKFDITDLSIGESVTLTLTFPESLSEGTTYWKYGKTQDNTVDHWYEIPVGDSDGDNIITITLTDGGLGDDDLTANGVIVDDGGPGIMEATSAPTPGFEALFAIAVILAVAYLLKRER